MTKRTYTKRTKLAAVMAAEMSSMTEVSEATGIPLTTLDYWMDQPEFVAARSKTREDLAAEIKTVAHLAWKRIAQALASGEMEPRDAIFAAEKATSLQLLMTGEATARTENVSITDGLDDHEREVLGAAIRGEIQRRADSARLADAEVAAAALGTVSETGAEGA